MSFFFHRILSYFIYSLPSFSNGSLVPSELDNVSNARCQRQRRRHASNARGGCLMCCCVRSPTPPCMADISVMEETPTGDLLLLVTGEKCWRYPAKQTTIKIKRILAQQAVLAGSSQQRQSQKPKSVLFFSLVVLVFVEKYSQPYIVVSMGPPY